MSGKGWSYAHYSTCTGTVHSTTDQFGDDVHDVLPGTVQFLLGTGAVAVLCAVQHVDHENLGRRTVSKQDLNFVDCR